MWKIAFFSMLAVWLLTVVGAAYVVLDMGVTQTYAAVGYADCEAHRDLLDGVARSRLDRAALEKAKVKVVRSEGDYTRDVTLSELEVQYDAKGRYVGSQLGGSATPGWSNR